MTDLEKIIIIFIGILAFYVLWTLVMWAALRYAHKSEARWRQEARELAELAVTWQQHLAGANRYFNSATQIDSPPYADPVARARKTVKTGYEQAGQAVAMADHCSRREIRQRQPSDVFLILPPLSELSKWIHHAADIRRVASLLGQVRKARLTLAAIDSEIAVLGRQQKRVFEELRSRAAELESQRQKAAGSANPLITEGVSLAGAATSLDMVMETLLASDDPPRQNVVDAYRWYVEIKQILDEVDNKLRQRPSTAQDANYALQIALRQYARFEQALAGESRAQGPFPALASRALEARKQLGEVSALLQARKYPQALEQAQQLPISIQALHNTLDQVKLWRSKAADLYNQAYGLLASYETEHVALSRAFEMDISEPLMQAARSLVRNLDDLRVSEDLAMLSEANQLKRDFDLKIIQITQAQRELARTAQTYDANHALVNPLTIDAAARRADDLADQLAASHAAYQQQLAPDVLATLRSHLQSEWRLIAVQVNHPRESQLETLQKLLERPVQLLTQLNQACDQAEQILALKAVDRQCAQTYLRQIDQLMPECAQTAQNWDAPALAAVAGFQAQRDELAHRNDQPPTARPDYSTLQIEANLTLVRMRDFISRYKSDVNSAIKEIASLRGTLDGLARGLREMGGNGTRDLLVDPQFAANIQRWINGISQLPAGALLREYQAALDSGVKLLKTTRTYMDRLNQERDAFLAEQKRVQEHAQAVKERLEQAVQTGRAVHADDDRQRPDRIAPIRQQIEKADATLVKLNAARTSLSNGRADLQLADSLLDYAELMLQNL
ncbi:MAG: hypothetical protein M1140_02315 [Chloroflexi bacterium]|nr:hypothetical protein [Chloroflexota bacterium]